MHGPLDLLLLQLDDDGRLVTTSSTPSPSVYGITPESAMVNEIFHNPDSWDAHFDDLEGDMDYAGPDVDLDDFLYYGPRSGVTMHSASGSTWGERKVPLSPTSPHSNGSGYLQNKRHLVDLQVESLTLKSFESRHRVIPCLSPASSGTDSPSSPDSSTLSLDSWTSSLEQTNWKGMKDNAVDHNDINLQPLLALIEHSNNRSSKPGGKRLSILWSHQNIFRALPSPIEGDDEFDYDPDSHIRNSVSIRGGHHLLTTAFSRFEEEEEGSEDAARVVLQTTSTDPTITTRTMTTSTVSSPDVSSSSAGVTLVSASATWSVLELYGDSPPLSPVVPKMTGHFSLKPSDLDFASSSSSSPIHLLPPPPPPKRSVSAVQQLRIKPKLKGPRLAPGGPGGGRITSLPLVTKTDVPAPTPIPKSISWHDGKIRPLPEPPRSESPSGSFSSRTGSEGDSTSLLHLTPEADELSTLSRAKSLPMNSEKTSSRPLLTTSSYPLTPPTPIPSKASSILGGLHHKGNSESSSSSSQIRSRFPLPPPRPPLDIPLPPLPETADVDVDVMTSQKAPALVLQATNKDTSFVGSHPAGPSTGTGKKAIRVSPLSSSILQRLHTLELSAGGTSKLPSPTARHKPSASESSLMFSTNGRAHLSAKDTMSTLTPPLYKSRFAPDVPLPDATMLAKRTRKNVTPTVPGPSNRL